MDAALGPFRRRISVAVEGAVLGAVLGAGDFALHVEGTHVAAWRSPLLAIFFLVALYGMVLALGGFLLGSRRWLAGIALVTFTAGQLGFAAYRAGMDEHPVLSWLALACMVAVVALAVVLLLRRGLPFPPLRPGVAPAVGVAVLAIAVMGLLLPDRKRAPPGPFPPPPATDILDGRPNLLLITLDTVRADHLPVYGYRAIRTPALDRVAREGVVFDDAVVQAPITPVSHASILTGLTPTAHGLRNFDRENRLRDGVPTLAQILSAEGYRTGAVIAAPPLDPMFGLDRGFEQYRLVVPREFYPFRTAGRSLLATVLDQVGWVQERGASRPAAAQVDDALAWLERRRHTAFFLWLHLFDAHEPYAPPDWAQAADHHPGRSAGERRGRVFLYDSEIVGMDAALARLFDRLDALGLTDQTLVVIASDHGDGLGDHGYYGHTARLYQEQTRMVLLLRWPKHLPSGTRVPSQVRSIDIVPTVLALLGSRCPPVEGTDLRPWIAGGARGHLPAYSETLEPVPRSRQLAAYDDGRFKLVRSFEGRSWLFDHLRDPGERQDVGPAHPQPGSRLALALGSQLEGSFTARAEPDPIDPELRERLGSLGYLDGPPVAPKCLTPRRFWASMPRLADSLRSGVLSGFAGSSRGNWRPD